ncbi:neuron derived neurotrophic factor nord [Anticarsia gemmatalis]|uniref:neuron derived neurotrophic factor nord n=1 Tax=Anticarsia gemmatalis TaxID=129554 RepID=UPI003F762644
MGKLNIFTMRLASLIVLHAAGAGLASPTVLVTRPVSRVAVEWLPIDNQTVYRLGEGESRSLELNTTLISQSVVFITISPCSRDFHWALYHGKSSNINGQQLTLQKESGNGEMSTISLDISQQDRYVLVLSSNRGGAAVVSVRGEATRQVRMRLRVRSRRRLAANWEPSPIDPQATTYCVVASHRKNYTSLCAAQYDIKTSRIENKSNRLSHETKDRENDTQTDVSTEVDNKINVDDTFNIYEGNFNTVFRRKKFGRSTRVTDEDPVIACVGSRTHHLIENLDPSTTYYVSVFGVAKDRRSGSLLATGSVRPRTSTAKRLRENQPSKVDIRGRNVFYFKATVVPGGGLWLSVSTCGGAVDVEVLVRGKRLHLTRNIDPHSKFFVPAPIAMSSIQETSDEGSVQFDSSSEEARMRYVIKVMPSRRDRDNAVAMEITASTTRWGVSAPELLEDGANVRELRPRRSCKSVDVAFLPATHNATDVIRYCIVAREINGESYSCWSARKSLVKGQCINHSQKSARVIVQKIVGLKAGRKYAVQVMALNKGNSVPYNMLYVDTNASCKDE